MIYTGTDYVGRNTMMTKSVDAVIIYGLMDTLHEFATAFGIQKSIGVLEGTAGTADKIRTIISGPFRRTKKIIYDKDPKELLRKIIKVIEIEKERNSKIKK